MPPEQLDTQPNTQWGFAWKVVANHGPWCAICIWLLWNSSEREKKTDDFIRNELTSLTKAAITSVDQAHADAENTKQVMTATNELLRYFKEHPNGH